MHVIATAGHVDHGKSTLVQTLTGSDPDRLAEEKRRGLTIQLGYCWTTLPGVGDVAFVDVPGHERFIPTMLAGVGPVPAVLFVAAADDDWMPQAAEHLAALDALDVRHGVVAVTRCDLADPTATIACVRRVLRSTSLAGSPVIPVSARTGSGIESLRAALAQLVAGLPPPDPSAPARLWVDRSFTVRGTGRVVTGTLSTGSISVGQRLSCSRSQVRVKRIECLEREVDTVAAVARVALALGGDVPQDLGRGSVLTGLDSFFDCSLIDVRLRGRTEDMPARAVLHIGATKATVVSRALGPDLVRLRLDRSVPVHVGDRGLLRDPGNRALWGFVVIDPIPPVFLQRGDARRRAAALAGASGQPDVGGEIERRGVVEISTLRKIGVDCRALDEHAIVESGWALDRRLVAYLSSRLADLVDEHDRSRPYETGLPVISAARDLGLPAADLVRAVAMGPLRVLEGRVVRDHPSDDELPVLDETVRRIESLLVDNPFAAPTADQLARAGADRKLVARAARSGRLLRLSDAIVLLPDAVDRARGMLAGLRQPFTTAEARVALDTSRRVAVPLLEHLDRLGITKRLADDRREIVKS